MGGWLLSTGVPRENLAGCAFAEGARDVMENPCQSQLSSFKSTTERSNVQEKKTHPPLVLSGSPADCGLFPCPETKPALPT